MLFDVLHYCPSLKHILADTGSAVNKKNVVSGQGTLNCPGYPHSSSQKVPPGFASFRAGVLQNSTRWPRNILPGWAALLSVQAEATGRQQTHSGGQPCIYICIFMRLLHPAAAPPQRRAHSSFPISVVQRLCIMCLPKTLLLLARNTLRKSLWVDSWKGNERDRIQGLLSLHWVYSGTEYKEQDREWYLSLSTIPRKVRSRKEAWCWKEGKAYEGWAHYPAGHPPRTRQRYSERSYKLL